MFEAPTLLRSSRRRLDEERRSGSNFVLPPLVAGERSSTVALSHAQERLWFLEQLRAGAFYHIAGALRLEGILDVAALERAFGEVVRRHESLRTRFAAADGVPVQRIEAAGAFALDVIDLAGLCEAERDGQARRLAREEVEQRFDLAREPLLRARLLRLGAHVHVALVTMHHIVSDGWSQEILIRELSLLYAAFVAGRGSPLGDLPVQYADYALWQRKWLQSEALARQVDYWKERLAGAPSALELPSDRARPAVASHRGATVPFAATAALSAGLGELSRREGATLHMVLLAAFAMLLGRWSGQRDIVVGAPIAGRSHRETEGLIGFFVNTLALRMNLSGEPSFRALLGRVKETALGAYAHQDLPFEKLVEVLQPVRDLSRQPVFQVMLAFQNLPQNALDIAGVKLTALESASSAAKFDLTLFVTETPGGLIGQFEYATDLFEAATIERLAGHFANLLVGIVADPTCRVSALPLLTPAERHQLVEEWNATAAEHGPRQVRARAVCRASGTDA